MFEKVSGVFEKISGMFVAKPTGLENLAALAIGHFCKEEGEGYTWLVRSFVRNAGFEG